MMIRETITDTVTIEGAGYSILSRRINLPDGKRFTVESIDVFNDMGAPWLRNTLSPGVVGYQLFITPYPVVVTNNQWGTAGALLGASGPFAGDNCVLYKEQALTTLDDFQEQQNTKIWKSQFPNDVLAANLNEMWYTPHLYVTMLIFNEVGTEIPIAMSVLVKTKDKRVSAVEHAMGCYQENLEAQCRLLSSMGEIRPVTRNAGYTFPMWRFGGIRPELMVTGTVALQYYNRVAANANQEMVTRDDFEADFEAATTMSAFNEAFGDPAADIPAWVELEDVAGVTSGPIRPYPPPIRFADNGNTRMF